MAEIGITEKFHAIHGSNPHEHDFKVEVVIEGNIDKNTGYVEGIDIREVVRELKSITSHLEGKNLKIFLTGKGFKSSGMESIASYFLSLLKKKFPVKCVKVWETENKYALVYSKET